MAGDDDVFLGIGRDREARLPLPDGRAGMEVLDRRGAMLALAEKVDLGECSADDLVAYVSGELDETLVDLDVAQVGEPADHCRSRVRPEHALEPLLRLVTVAGVLQQKREAGRCAGIVRRHQSPHPMRPYPRGIPEIVDLDHRVAKRLAGQDALDRMLQGADLAVVAVAQDEVGPVLSATVTPRSPISATPCIARAASLA